ncbi:hypothetical protein ACB092_11G198500 [Castanea dentata]
MQCAFHSSLGSTHCCTINCSSTHVRGPAISFRMGPQGNQKSFQKLIDLPLLTIHFSPSTYSTGPAILQAAHTLEQGKFFPSSVSRLRERYFAVSILAQRASRLSHV